MANSIQDQLLKAGLVTEEQAQAATRSLQEPRRPARGGARADRSKGGAGRARSRGSSAQAGADGDAGRAPFAKGKRKNGKGRRKGRGPGKSAAGDTAGVAPAAFSGKDPGELRPATAKLRSDLQRAQKVLGDSLLSVSPEQQARKAAHAELARLLRRVRVNDPRAEHPFNFVRKQRIKRLFVTEEQRGQLASGELVIVGVDGKNHLLPAVSLQGVLALEPRAHVFRTDDPEGTGTSGETVDPEYEDYEVPDDIRW